MGADAYAAGPIEAVRLADSLFGLIYDAQRFAGY